MPGTNRSLPGSLRGALVLGVALGIGSPALSDPPAPRAAGKPAVLEHEPLFGAGDPDPAASGNPLLAPIPEDAPTDASSDLYVARMLSEIDAGGFRLQLGSSAYPVYYTSDDPADPTPRRDVTLTALSGSGAWGYCGKKWIRDVPIPTFVEADPSSDGRMIVVDRETSCVYDFWGYGGPPIVPGDPTPRSYWVAGLPFESIGIHPQGDIGAGRAANFMAANGLVWPDELAAGHIPHAISFGYAADAILERSWVAPATHSDGSSLDIDALPEGARLQLNPAIDLGALGLDPHLATIGRALQEYGMYLADGNGGGVALGGVSGLSANPDPWSLVPGMPDPLPNALPLVALLDAAEAALPEGAWLLRVLALGEIRTNVPPICPNNPCVTYAAPAPCTGCCAAVAGPDSGRSEREAPLAFVAVLSLLGVADWRRRVRKRSLRVLR